MLASSTLPKGIVMPAKAGIQGAHGLIKRVRDWIPVFTGMTKGEACRIRIEVSGNIRHRAEGRSVRKSTEHE